MEIRLSDTPYKRKAQLTHNIKGENTIREKRSTDTSFERKVQLIHFMKEKIN